MRRVAFVIEYDGTDFFGSQYQSNARTVQGDLEAAARLVLKIGERRVVLSGRTDAGVHATHQVGAVDTESELPLERIRDAMNGNLAPDVGVVRAVDVADAAFEPRRHAVGRTYRYVLNFSGVRSPLRHRYEARLRKFDGPPDIELMRQCASQLVGTHDFSSFGGVGPLDAVTVRTIDSFVVQPLPEGRLELVVAGRSFLRQQVRRMVGLLFEIGHGRADAGEVQRHLEHPAEGAVEFAMPASGLTLIGIEYPSHLRGISASERDAKAYESAWTLAGGKLES